MTTLEISLVKQIKDLMDEVNFLKQEIFLMKNEILLLKTFSQMKNFREEFIVPKNGEEYKDIQRRIAALFGEGKHKEGNESYQKLKDFSLTISMDDPEFYPLDEEDLGY